MHISIQAYSWDDQDSVVCVASTFNKNYFCSISQSSSILISAPISEVPKKLGGFFMLMFSRVKCAQECSMFTLKGKNISSPGKRFK